MGRNSGRYIFVEASVALRVSDLTKAHQISERLESKIREMECCVDRVLIHYEPEAKTTIRYAIPVTSSIGEISSHFGESPHFVMIDIDTGTKQVTKREIIDNPHLGLEKGKGIKVAQFLLAHKPDVVIAGEQLSGKRQAFGNRDVEIECHNYYDYIEYHDSQC